MARTIGALHLAQRRAAILFRETEAGRDTGKRFPHLGGSTTELSVTAVAVR